MFSVFSFDCKISYLSQGSSLFSTVLPKQWNFIPIMTHHSTWGWPGQGSTGADGNLGGLERDLEFNT